MIFVKSFKGYEDKAIDLDKAVNEWIAKNKVDVVDIKSALSHENSKDLGRMHSGDLVYTVLYRGTAPIA